MEFFRQVVLETDMSYVVSSSMMHFSQLSQNKGCDVSFSGSEERQAA